MILAPKISIIIPTFNCEATLEACLRSILIQTYENKEILIIDGQSQDNTLSIINRYQQEIRWVSEKDEGIYDAMNKGIRMATGDWLYFLGSDDRFYDEYVLTSLFASTVDLSPEILYGNVKFKHSGIYYDGAFSRYKLLHKNICHQAIFVKRSVFTKLGLFEVKYKLLADWHFNMKWYNHPEIRHKFVNNIIAIYNEDGLSFNVIDKQFVADRYQIENTYFPWIIRWLFRNKDRRFMKKLLFFFYHM